MRRRRPAGRLAARPRLLGAGAAAAPRRVEVARLGELLEQAAGHRRLLVVAAERIREPGGRIARAVDRPHPRPPGDVPAQLRPPERAVEAPPNRLRWLGRLPVRP